MPTYIALLRGVNVAGQKMISMAALRDLVTRLGFGNSRSLLQSGNLIFDGDSRADDKRSGNQIERRLETETEKQLGLKTDFLVRTAAELDEVIAHNPFPREAKADPGHLVAMFLKEQRHAEHLAALRAAIVGRETIKLIGKHAYITYPDGIGRSKLTTALLDRKLQTRGTGRNWNTVLKLAAAAL